MESQLLNEVIEKSNEWTYVRAFVLERGEGMWVYDEGRAI